jgi:predicted DNA-binding transcriptional regulator AlpA
VTARNRSFSFSSLAGDRIQSEVGSAARIADIRSKIQDVVQDPNSKAELRALVECLGGGLACAQAAWAELLYKPETQERLLTIDEAAEVLSVERRWLYRNSHKLPFVVRPSEGVLRFSSLGIQQWINGRGKL